MNRGCRWQLENVLIYNKTIGFHSFTVILELSAIKYTGRRLGGSAQDLIDIDGSKASIDD